MEPTPKLRFLSARLLHAARRVHLLGPRLLLALLALLLVLQPQPAAAGGPPIDQVRKAIESKGLHWQPRQYDREFALGLLPPAEAPAPLAAPPPAGALPSSVDWRDHSGNFVSPIKDQGQCGSCWAFASVAGLESELAISSNTPGSFDDLSEQMLVSCEPYNLGCDQGGWLGHAADYLQETGVADEACYPYRALDRDTGAPCSDRCADWSTRTRRITSYTRVYHSVDALRAALVSGPVVVAFAVPGDFGSYGSGVYEHATGVIEGYHAVLAVGYVDTPGEYGGGYFIVKNSWGPYWGEDGYFRIGYSQVADPDVIFGYDAYLYDIRATPGRDVAVHKSLVSADPEPGGTLTYRLAYANLGDTPASGVQIVDTLPSGLTYLSCTGPTPSIAGQTLTWSLGTLPSVFEAGSSGEFEVTVSIGASVPAGTWLEGQAEISTADTETDATGSGLTGSYYAYDPDAIGLPPNDPFNNGELRLRQVDRTIDSDWYIEAPQPLIPNDHFAIRWSGYVYAPQAGTYTFATTTDDGSRLWVNGTQLVDDWTQHGMETRSGQIDLAGGQWYSIQLDYHEQEGAAGARLQWQPPDGAALVAIPQEYLSPQAGYANNRSALGVRVRAPLKTGDVLLVLDYGGYDTDWFRPYFTTALDDAGYDYDVWDTEIEGAPEAWVLDQYLNGVVVWSAPWWGHIIYPFCFDTVESYLDSGGRLFLTSQDAGYYLNNWGNTGFLNGYLHAGFIQDSSGLRAVAGVPGDPIGDSLTLSLAGGDGANNQGDPDEFTPLYPAVPAFTYTALAAAAPEGEDAGQSALPAPTPIPGPGGPAAPVGATDPTPPPATASSGAAGLHVDTGTYSVVYLGFGLEGINSAAGRAAVMERALAWLRETRPALLSPENGQALPPGTVTFSWTSVPGASGYRIQIDSVPTFDSGSLISQAVTGTSCSRSLTAKGTYYWRVRAEPGGSYSAPWSFTIAGPLVRLTTDPNGDESPGILRATNGRLWVVWDSYRSNNQDIYYKTSTDGGTTWSSDRRLTTDPGYDYQPAIAQAADGRIWVVWYSYRSGSGDIYYKTSTDGGATWSADTRLTTSPYSDYGPAITVAADGRIWVAWCSYRTGTSTIWYKTSGDGGATWSADAQLTAMPDAYNPAIAQAADGRIWVLWESSGRIWASSTPGYGSPWSTESAVSPDGVYAYGPALAVTSDRALWAGWVTNDGYSDNNISYARSTDGGATWSAPARLTRFTGYDESPSFAAGAGGALLAAWQSDRATNYDIWFGIPGQREDLSPPPHIDYASHDPAPNPDDTQAVTIRARLSDETGVQSAQLLWSRNGVTQASLTLFDDGAHGDYGAGDSWYGTRIGPFPAGTTVSYRIRVRDTDGNVVEGNPVYASYPPSFVVQPKFVPSASLLLVADGLYDGGTLQVLPYYGPALEARGNVYDVWDTYLRGAPGTATLAHYDAVIWAMPYWGYLGDYRGHDASQSLSAYLDAGGRLFISGQDVGYYLNYNDTDFLSGYLHARFVQDDSGLYALAGVAGDPIGDGLALNISGGDGANNQYWKDEIDPIAPAVPVLTYAAGSSTPLAAPSAPLPLVPESPGRERPLPGHPGAEALAPTAPRTTGVVGSVMSSGTAALRVDTGTYKLVYFAFGFEAINSEDSREQTMDRVLEWLGVPRGVALAQGWNLVSLPVVPPDTSPPAVLSSIAGKYDVVYGPDGAGGWQRYAPGASGNDLTEMVWGKGYWIHTTRPTALTVMGTPPASTDISLAPGWNLVGYPGDTAQPAASALASIAGKYDLVYAYDATDASKPWHKYNPALPPALNDLTQMAPGKGYWIHVTEACTWSMP